MAVLTMCACVVFVAVWCCAVWLLCVVLHVCVIVCVGGCVYVCVVGCVCCAPVRACGRSVRGACV